jgi:hypothetical protein
MTLVEAVERSEALDLDIRPILARREDRGRPTRHVDERVGGRAPRQIADRVNARAHELRCEEFLSAVSSRSCGRQCLPATNGEQLAVLVGWGDEVLPIAQNL